MKTITFFASLFVLFFGRVETSNIPPFALITLPKSGSHLMIKALYFLTGSEPLWHTKFPSFQYVPGDLGFLYTHFCISPELAADYEELPELKKMILIRDLRDITVSIVSQIRKSPWPGMTNQEREAFLKMSFDEQLLFVINFEYDVRAVAKKAPNSLQVSLSRIAEQALFYSQKPDVITFRYEDLVGPNGGGTRDAQIAQMERIRDFLQLDVSNNVLQEVAEKVYGDSVHPFGHYGFQNFQSTFQVGKIGRWKDFFKEEHKVVFKKKLGNVLIALGYEKDENW